MDKEAFKQLLNGIDFAELLPDINEILSIVPPTAKILMLCGSFIMLAFGLYCLMIAPREATYSAGYRFRWGMGSVAAWRFMQRCAGVIFLVLGFGCAVYMALHTRDVDDLALMDLLTTAAMYILLQIGVALVGCLLVNLAVIIRYDWKGNRRYTWRELWKG